MAKGIINLTFAEGLMPLYDALNSLGFITATCGTPTGQSIIFTGPLCEAGTYIRFRLNNISSISNDNYAAWDIGTVSGSTFTSKREGSVYINSQDLGITDQCLMYDTVENFIIYIRFSTAANLAYFVYIGALSNGLKVGFMAEGYDGALATNVKGIIPIDCNNLAAALYIWTFISTIKIGSAYLEQNIYVRDTTGALVSVNSIPVYLKGITNVSLSGTGVIQSSDWVLFAAKYQGFSDNMNFNIYTYLKMSLI